MDDNSRPDLQDLLRVQRVWDTDLPGFDPEGAPAEPLPLFLTWFAEAVAAAQTEPHTMSLATVDDEGRPDVRIVMLRGADEEGWWFGSHSGSRKGRQLSDHPHAALCFYWSAQGRQIRVRGRVTATPPERARADLHARSTGALASALVGHQSEVLDSYAELQHASAAAWEQARREPDTDAPSWTLYALDPYEVEFFQGDDQRCHVRLNYRLIDGRWVRDLLWP